MAVAAANKHSCAITSHGELLTWGANHEGQLGYGTSDSQSNPAPRLVEALKGKAVSGASAAKRHTVAVTREGEVYTWGHKVGGVERMCVCVWGGGVNGGGNVCIVMPVHLGHKVGGQGPQWWRSGLLAILVVQGKGARVAQSQHMQVGGHGGALLERVHNLVSSNLFTTCSQQGHGCWCGTCSLGSLPWALGVAAPAPVHSPLTAHSLPDTWHLTPCSHRAGGHPQARGASRHEGRCACQRRRAALPQGPRRHGPPAGCLRGGRRVAHLCADVHWCSAGVALR